MHTPNFLRNKSGWRVGVALLLAALLLLAAARAGGQTGGYSLLHYSPSAGNGAWLSGGGYTAAGASGQHDSGTSAGGLFTLAGGVQPPGQDSGIMLYLPFVRR